MIVGVRAPRGLSAAVQAGLFPLAVAGVEAEEEPELYANFLANELPERRLGTDREVAEVISFLCSTRSRWVNGTMIPVDGGQGRPTGKWFV